MIYHTAYFVQEWTGSPWVAALYAIFLFCVGLLAFIAIIFAIGGRISDHLTGD